MRFLAGLLIPFVALIVGVVFGWWWALGYAVVAIFLFLRFRD